ncbi:MAG: ribosome silencing factor, partial [Planctomycetota bacterium]
MLTDSNLLLFGRPGLAGFTGRLYLRNPDGFNQGDFTIRTDLVREFAIACARLADKKKADDIVILNLKKQEFIVDYFVICSVRNKKQAQGIADELIRPTKENYRPTPSVNQLPFLGMDGYKTGSWVLVDFGDVMVHVFQDLAGTSYHAS